MKNLNTIMAKAIIIAKNIEVCSPSSSFTLRIHNYELSYLELAFYY